MKMRVLLVSIFGIFMVNAVLAQVHKKVRVKITAVHRAETISDSAYNGRIDIDLARIRTGNIQVDSTIFNTIIDPIIWQQEQPFFWYLAGPQIDAMIKENLSPNMFEMKLLTATQTGRLLCMDFACESMGAYSTW